MVIVCPSGCFYLFPCVFSCVHSCVCVLFVSLCVSVCVNWFILGPSATTLCSHALWIMRTVGCNNKKIRNSPVGGLLMCMRALVFKCPCMHMHACISVYLYMGSACCIFRLLLLVVLSPGRPFGFSCCPPSLSFLCRTLLPAWCLSCVCDAAAPSVFWRKCDTIQSPDNRMLRRRTTTILGTTAAHQTQDVLSEHGTESLLIAH